MYGIMATPRLMELLLKDHTLNSNNKKKDSVMAAFKFSAQCTLLCSNIINTETNAYP